VKCHPVIIGPYVSEDFGIGVIIPAIKSDVQFGFKENLFCARAIFTLQEVLHYFNKQHLTDNLTIFQKISII